MSAMVVPVVIKRGGQRKIVVNEKTRYHWNTIDDLVMMIRTLMQDEEISQMMPAEVRTHIQEFSRSRFVLRVADFMSSYKVMPA